jgi:hypothetical protein
MSAQLGLLQMVSSLLAHVLRRNGQERHSAAGDPAPASTEQRAARSPESDYSERDSEEREHQLRVMMATWM